MKYLFKHVVDAKYIKDYRLWLKFNDGKSGEVDLAERISWGEVFKPLKNINYFKNFCFNIYWYSLYFSIFLLFALIMVLNFILQ